MRLASGPLRAARLLLRYVIRRLRVVQIEELSTLRHLPARCLLTNRLEDE